MTEKTPSFSIQYHADRSLNELRDFSSCTLAIDARAIKLPRKSNSKQLASRSWRSRHGVLTVRVRETRFRARRQAWTDRVRSERQ